MLPAVFSVGAWHGLLAMAGFNVCTVSRRLESVQSYFFVLWSNFIEGNMECMRGSCYAWMLEIFLFFLIEFY